MPLVFVALGSNVGDRHRHLNEAISRVSRIIDDVRLSPVYETDPMYITDQPMFLNSALVGNTNLGPLNLLDQLKGIELNMGRQNRNRFDSREIDLDLILYGSLQLRSQTNRRLDIPHPKIIERRFVLQPLFDLCDELTVPGLGRISDLLASTNDQTNSIRLFNHAPELSVQSD